MRVALVHSPLVGPATWRWVADELRVLGHEPVVPDLRGAAASGAPGDVIGAVVAAAGDASVIVGHSGGGYFLPWIAARLAATPTPTPVIVFVDAGVPPCDGAAAAGGNFLPRLRDLAVDGLLPPWSTWWGEHAMSALVRDVDRRHAVEAEIGCIPLRLYEAAMDVPARWCERVAAAYLLLSDAYTADAGRASKHGWVVIARTGGSHLDIVNDPAAIAGEIAALLDRNSSPLRRTLPP